MLVYLSFLVCLHGTACHVTVPLERPLVGLSACQIEGMQMAPQWEDAHHGWSVSRIRCSMGRPPKSEDDA